MGNSTSHDVIGTAAITGGVVGIVSSTAAAVAVAKEEPVLEDNEWVQTQAARLLQIVATQHVSPSNLPYVTSLIGSGAVMRNHQDEYNTILSNYAPPDRFIMAPLLSTLFNLDEIERGQYERVAAATDNAFVHSWANTAAYAATHLVSPVAALTSSEVAYSHAARGLVSTMNCSISAPTTAESLHDAKWPFFSTPAPAAASRPTSEADRTRVVDLVTEHYITCGIGSAGSDILGVPKADESAKDKIWLSTDSDLSDMKYYASKYNVSGGKIDFAGIGGKVSMAKTTIEVYLQYASKQAACLILYYTGHGCKDTGNWSFTDGTLTFDDVYQMIVKAKVKTYIIADCCYSGCWVTKAKKIKSPFCEVIAASGSDTVAYNCLFSKAFWRGERLDDALQPKPCKSLQWKESSNEQMNRNDLLRCWFINKSKYNVDWKEIEAKWRPPPAVVKAS